MGCVARGVGLDYHDIMSCHVVCHAFKKVGGTCHRSFQSALYNVTLSLHSNSVLFHLLLRLVSAVVQIIKSLSI